MFSPLPIPHVKQRRVGDCLPACAKMVLDYCGVSIPYQKLVEKLETIPGFATRSSNIVRLKDYGVLVEYKQGVIENLRDNLIANRPCIVFLEMGELPYLDEQGGHAVVVIGMDERFIYVNDPSMNSPAIPVPIGDFDLAWLENDEWYAVVDCDH